ncbi:MAG: bacillithiol system redox-active protein YtxJ [Bacteroidetes bacterium]|nr:bacillithiol system redox-active protein YtxJ [Bacteroidota bacterium]
MGLLNKLFGASNDSEKEEKYIPWNRLTTLEQLDDIVKESMDKPVAIFKHSTRCGTSRMALRQFEKQYSLVEDSAKLYFLDLIAFREVSNEIAIQFQVLHQSPQLVVVKNGNTVHHSSHYSIDATLLETFV